MGWREQYRQAKFRNVSFFVARIDNSGGRRVALHEFPKQDTPFSEDMGRKARTHTVDAYILGEDYFGDRDRLLKALEAEGPGKLIHPYLGTLIVSCTGYRMTEDRTEGRMARFALDFVESGEALFPSVELNTKKTAQIKKNTAYDTIESTFNEAYSVANVPTTVVKRTRSTVQKAIDYIDEKKKAVAANAEFQRQLAITRGKIVELTYLAEDLSNETIYLLTFGTDQDDDFFEATATNARQQIREMLAFFDFAPDDGLPADYTDPSAQVSYMIQETAASAMAGLITLVEFESVQDAEEFQRQLLEQIDKIIQQPIPDTLYVALIDLRTAVIRDIERRATVLPQIIEYTHNVSIPSLALSWALYGSVDFETDIINRNRVENPAFVPGAQPLQLLSYAEQ